MDRRAIQENLSDKPGSVPADFNPEASRLLIVDDNPLNLLYMKQLLSKYNAVLTAKNGHEALETLRSNTVDVVITDINMPILDGHELLNNIRADKNLRHIKVIATSSDDEQIYAADKKSDPRFDHILIKPFDEKKISSVIYSLKIESELHSSFE